MPSFLFSKPNLRSTLCRNFAVGSLSIPIFHKIFFVFLFTMRDMPVACFLSEFPSTKLALDSVVFQLNILLHHSIKFLVCIAASPLV